MVHQFKNNGYDIVLDVNSGAIHVVDDVTYDVIAMFEEHTPDEIVQQLKEQYPEAEIKEAIDEVLELKKNEELFTEDVYKSHILDFKKRPTVVKALCLHIAHDCNLACKYCFAEEGEYHGRRALMSYETGKQALDFLIANSGSRKNLEVDFFGGEPLMNFDVVKQLVAYGREQEKLHDKHFRFTLTTNGVLLNDDIMEFANKEYFFLLLLLIPYVLWYFLYRKKNEPTIRMSDTFAYQYAPKSWRIRIINLPMLLRCITFVLIVIILVRPQTHNAWDKKEVEGIDIMLVMDVSTSMLAEDLRPNRIEAAKNVAAEFINGRPNDNIGLTIFAGEAFTQCPMTTDHTSLLNMLQTVRTDIAARGLIQDGTAVGMGLASAVARLKDSKAKSKVVILLTDGSNNMGDLSPMTSAQIAKSMGIRVYTIGVGTNKVARYPAIVAGGVQYVNIPVEIDTKTQFREFFLIPLAISIGQPTMPN